MLVLTRRTNEHLSFPDVGITIHFIRIQSGSAKIGVDAPLHIQVVRNESYPDEAGRAEELRRDLLRLPRKIRHDIRNELHAIGVGLHLYREQMRLGMLAEADETFQIVQDSLKRLDENHVLRRPVPRAVRPSRRQANVLIVAPASNERELLAGILRYRGYAVSCATDHRNALPFLVGPDSPQLVLVDIPDSHAIDTLRIIRQSAASPEVRMYALVENELDACQIPCGSDGVDRWFPKPIQVELLMESIEADVEPAAAGFRNAVTSCS